MAKNSIPDYSATAASNTDIQSVNIDEGCAPSGINNAIRELMVDLKNMDTGAVALTSPQMTSVDINGGTVDGVTLGTNSAVTEAQVDNININGNAITSTDTNGNIALTPNGTGEVDISKVDIDSGAIDGTTIGASSAAAITGTTITATGDVDIADKIVHTGDTNTSVRFPAADTVSVETGGTERLRIDSSGNVGIGTNAPYDDGVNFSVLNLNGAKGGRLAFTRGTNSAVEQWSIRTSDDDILRFNYGSAFSSEAMRIDSSGNLLVGKTTLGAGTNGFEARSTGETVISVDSNICLDLNRTTNDGNIILLRQATTSLGSIGNRNDSLYFRSEAGTSGSGIRFSDAYVMPCTSDGSNSDNTTDLGLSGSRFKDLYLSGGAYLGGTGSANLLDDYEEGTWTGTVSADYGFTAGASPTINGNYVKIGDMVTVNCSIDFDTAETLALGDRFIIQGIPFIMTGSQNGVGGGSFIQPGSFAGGTHVVGTVASNSNSQDELMCVVTRVNGTPPALNVTNVNLGMTYKITNTF